jgi:queuosine precursor transporter
MPRSLFIFSLIYGGLVCMAGVLGTKIVALGPLTVEAGIIAFLQLVVLSSAVSELHGSKVATQLVRYGFIPLILSALLIISQTLNVYLFDKLRAGTGSMVWLRGGIAAVASQIVDTGLFITIAFLGVLPIMPLLISGITAKVVLSVIMVPPLISLAVSLGKRLDQGVPAAP